VWALSDQAVLSLGTFGTHVVLARSLPAAEYGVFALLYGAILLVNTVHASLVVDPLSVHGAPAEGDGMRRLVRGSLGLTAVVAPVLGLVAAGATWLLGRAELAPGAVAAVGLWQLHETYRRVLLAQLRHKDALTGDAASYLGQAALLVAVAALGQASIQTTLFIMAGTSAAGAALHAVKVGVRSMDLTETSRLVRGFWAFGRWSLLSALLAALAVQVLPWATAFFRDLSAAAAFQALANVCGAINPVMFAAGGLITPAAARAVKQSGVDGAYRVARRHAAEGAAVLLPYFAVVLLWPEAVLQAFYGAGSAYHGLELELRVLTFGSLLAYVAFVLNALLYGLGDSRSGFVAQVGGAVTAVAVGLPMVRLGGVLGACLASAAASLVRASVSRHFLVRARQSAREVGDRYGQAEARDLRAISLGRTGE
jgi:O-antigen/teichoic acid export membrane protein